MSKGETIVISCDSMTGICKYNDYGSCKLSSINLDCGECSSFEEEDTDEWYWNKVKSWKV